MPTLSASLWHALEMSISEVPAVWRRRLGEQFDVFKAAFLKTKALPAHSYPCQKCCCNLDLIIHAPDDIDAACASCPWNCEHLKLTAADIQVLELDCQKLARALCHALALEPKSADFGLHHTRQIGSWSADSVPVILTIQRESYDFQHVVAVLAAKIRKKFILLAPTANHLNAESQEILTNLNAEFFALDSHLILTDEGTLQPRRAPGEIFARFRPEPIDVEEMLRKAIALVKAVDSGQGNRRVTLYTVMRLYCFDLLEANQIASRCGCALSLAYRRLDELRQKLGRDPAELRAYATQFERMEKDLTDDRAKHIHRPSAIHGDEDNH